MRAPINVDRFQLEDWLNYYTTLHPVGIDLGLARIQKVYNRLQINQIAKEKVITVSGTNGKGSSCQMLSLILRKQQYKVGVFSSPHLTRYNERITINGEMASDDEIIAAFNQIEIARKDIGLTYFEVSVLACFLIFKARQVDFAILEVGLGGRLDAVNIIDADAAIITSIALDHQAYLGFDLSTIVMEKAGVFRAGAPAVCAEPCHYPNLVDYCQKELIPLTVAKIDYDFDSQGKIKLGDREIELPANIIDLGIQQIQNAAGVCELLNRLDYLPESAEQSLANFQLAGRLQFLSHQPDIIVDVAHNPAAAIHLLNFLTKNYQHQSIKVIFGMLSDKDVQAVLSLFIDIVDCFYLVSTTGERGVLANNLAEQLDSLGVSSKRYLIYEEVEDALNSARLELKQADVLVCFGSFLVVSDLISCFEKSL